MPSESLTFGRVNRIGGAVTTVWLGGYEYSLWEMDGNPSGGAQPTTWANPTSTTIGGLFQTDPTGSLQKWLVQYCLTGGASGRLLVYDRLLHVGGFSGTVTTAQNVNAGAVAAVSRYTNGIGNSTFLEIYSAVGATPVTASVVYTDENGTSATATGPLGSASATAGRRAAQGATRVSNPTANPGVKDVTGVTLSGSTGTAGNFGLVVAHELASFELSFAGISTFGSFLDQPVEVLSGACLAFTFCPYGAPAVQSYPVFGSLRFVDK